MSITDDTIKVLPLVYWPTGQPVTIDAVFEHLDMYEIVTGSHKGCRGTLGDLKRAYGNVVVLNWISAISCETGDILMRTSHGYVLAWGAVL